MATPAPSHRSPVSLAVSAHAGDPAARARLLAWIEPRVRLMVAVRIEGHVTRRVVDDATADILDHLFAELGELREEDDTQSFRGMVSATVHERMRARRAERRPTPLLPQEPFRDDAPSSVWSLLRTVTGVDHTPTSNSARRDRVTTLVEDVRALPRSQREPLVLAFFDQLGTGCVAEALRVDRDEAALRISRSVEALRKRWRERWRRRPG